MRGKSNNGANLVNARCQDLSLYEGISIRDTLLVLSLSSA